MKAYEALREAFEAAVAQGARLVEQGGAAPLGPPAGAAGGSCRDPALVTVQYVGYNGVRRTETTLQEMIELMLACEAADAAALLAL